MFDLSTRQTRPIPLLDSDLSSDESELVLPPTQRRSYTSLVSSQSPTYYHTLVLTFVCCVTFLQSLQTYLPLTLGAQLACLWDLSASEVSLLAIVYPMSSFISPLLHALLSHYPIRTRITVVLCANMMLLAASGICKQPEPLVVVRCLTGLVALPHSLLTQMWAHVFNPMLHTRCRQLISGSHRAGIAVSLVLLFFTPDYKVLLPVLGTLYIVPIVLSHWLTDTPIMLLWQGKYSHIMPAISHIFKGPAIDTLRLQELDLSEDLSRQAYDPMYMYNNRINKRNVVLVYWYKLVQGFTLFTTIITIPRYVESAIAAGKLCLHAITAPLLLAPVVSSLFATDLIPPLGLKCQAMLCAMLGSVTCGVLAGGIVPSSANVALACLLLASINSLHSILMHLTSTISISVAGECLAELFVSLALILAKVMYDIDPRVVLIAGAGGLAATWASAWFLVLPPTTDCTKIMDVEMDDPGELLEMEMEFQTMESGDELEGEGQTINVTEFNSD